MSTIQVVKPISSIEINLSINTRPISQQLVEEYADDMKGYGEDEWQDKWGERPKITANYHLWAGFHTLLAAKAAFGEGHMVTFYMEGKTLDDAFFNACKENERHGRRRSNIEKRVAVFRWLLHPKKKVYTDGFIADACKVSQNFVSNLCKELEDNLDDLSKVNIPREAFPNGEKQLMDHYYRPSKRQYRKSGKIQYIETQAIGSKPKPKKADLAGMKENLHRACTFSRTDLSTTISDHCVMFHVKPKQVEDEIERLRGIRDSFLEEIDGIYNDLPLADPMDHDYVEQQATLRHLYKEYPSFLTKVHLSVRNLEILRETMLQIREDIKEHTIDTLVQKAFPKDEKESDSLVNWDDPPDLPQDTPPVSLDDGDDEDDEANTAAEANRALVDEQMREARAERLVKVPAEAVGLYAELSEDQRLEIFWVKGKLKTVVRKGAGLPQHILDQCVELHNDLVDYEMEDVLVPVEKGGTNTDDVV